MFWENINCIQAKEFYGLQDGTNKVNLPSSIMMLYYNNNELQNVVL